MSCYIVLCYIILCCLAGLNKPAQQTLVPAAAVPGLLGPLPLPKLRQLGGKFGEELMQVGRCNTCTAQLGCWSAAVEVLHVLGVLVLVLVGYEASLKRSSCRWGNTCTAGMVHHSVQSLCAA
jgi:hypothetical protein